MFSGKVTFDPSPVEGLENEKIIALCPYESEAIFVTEDNKIFVNKFRS